MQNWTDGAVAEGSEMPADPKAANEAWVDAVRIAEQRGYKQHYRKAATASDVLIMQDQNRLASRRSFGMPAGYDRIQWRKSS